MFGIIVGRGGLFLYMFWAHMYLGDDPAACVNCLWRAPYIIYYQHIAFTGFYNTM